MILSKFSFSAFRGFVSEQTLTFAIPNDTEIGSGLTYIVGENNSGKTSVLEGMHFSGQRHQPQSQPRTSDINGPSVHFTFHDDSGEQVQNLIPTRPGSYSLEDNAVGTKSSQFSQDYYPIFVPSRRYWSPTVLSDIDIEYARRQSYGYHTTLRRSPNSGSDTQIADLFYAIEKDRQSYDLFTEIMRKIFTDFSSFSITNEDSTFISYNLAGSTHRADFLGDGVVSIMRIVAHLVLHSNRLLVIDEPELSLHPAAQKKLRLVLAEASKRQQIVIATHSPYLLDWKYIKNGATLHRIVKTDNSIANIHTLKSYNTYAPLLNGGNWRQPYATDVVAKEIFFSEKILFLEGQEDVGLLHDDGALDPDITIFGYGVRGFRNFQFALQLAKDIGIQKAGAIIDKGPNEDSVLRELQERFPGYYITQWDREDIRDKDGFCPLDANGQPNLNEISMSKKGYFNSNGKKKQNSGDYEEKIESINAYFGN